MKLTLLTLALGASISVAATFTGSTNFNSITGTAGTRSLDVDVNGDSVADFQLVFNATATLVGNTYTGGAGNTRWVMEAAGDGLTFSFDTISVGTVYNSDVTVNSTSYLNYNQFGLWGEGGNSADSNWNTDTIDFEGTQHSASNVQHNFFNVAADAIGATTEVDFTWVSSDATSGLNLYNIGADFTVDYDLVPEPTSAALLGLGGLALVARRKRA